MITVFTSEVLNLYKENLNFLKDCFFKQHKKTDPIESERIRFYRYMNLLNRQFFKNYHRLRELHLGQSSILIKRKTV